MQKSCYINAQTQRERWSPIFHAHFFFSIFKGGDILVWKQWTQPFLYFLLSSTHVVKNDDPILITLKNRLFFSSIQINQ